MRKIPYLILTAVIITLDQLSKWFVTEYMVRTVLEKPDPQPMGFIEWLANAPEKLGPVSQPVLPFFNIVMVWNKGVSFGMFNQAGDSGPLYLTVLALIISVWFTAWLFYTNNRVQCLAIALVIAGAIGNVIDRVRFGAVIDFLDFHIAGLHWPAFNIADSCVVGGVFMLIIYSLFFEKTVHRQG